MFEVRLDSKKGVTVGDLLNALTDVPSNTEIDFYNDGNGDFFNVVIEVQKYDDDVYDVSVAVKTYNTIY